MKRLGTVILLLALLSLAACGRRLPEGGFVPEDLGPTSFDTNTAAQAADEAEAETAEEDVAEEEEADAEAEADTAAEEDAEAETEADAEADAETEDAAEEAATEDEAAVAEVDGDVGEGAALFANVPGNAPCSSCHYVDSEQMLVGPGMLGLGARAGDEVAGQDAVEYLRNSILHPNDHVVEGYPAQVMPQNYGDFLTEDDINDLIAYLLSL